MFWKPNPTLVGWFRDAIGPPIGTVGNRESPLWSALDSIFLSGLPSEDVIKLVPGDSRANVLLQAITSLTPADAFTCVIGGSKRPAFIRENLPPPSIYHSSVFGTMVLSEYLRAGDVFVDGGANVGVFTLVAASVIGRSGGVFAIEPNRMNTSLLQANVTLNGFDNVVGVQAALSNNLGTSILYRDQGCGYSHQMWEDETTAGSEEVCLQTIDNLCAGVPQVAAIKLDVQGYEMKALEGARETIKRSSSMGLMLEVWPKGLVGSGDSVLGLVDLLEDLGFTNVYLLRENHPTSLLRVYDRQGIISLTDEIEAHPEISYVDLWCLKSK